MAEAEDPIVEEPVVEEPPVAQAPQEPEEPKEPKKKKPLECPACEAGAPAWMATFADMATLLMASFVRILSFTEMDSPSINKDISGSISSASGLQRKAPEASYDHYYGLETLNKASPSKSPPAGSIALH